MNKEELQKLIEKHIAAEVTGSPLSMDQLYAILEPLLEDTAMQGRYSSAAARHLEEKNKEVSSLRLARNIFLWISAGLVCGVLGFFYWSFITLKGHAALAALGNAQIAFVSATFLSGFGILAIVIRGLFSTTDKDDSGGALVDTIKTLFEVGKGIVK